MTQDLDLPRLPLPGEGDHREVLQGPLSDVLDRVERRGLRVEIIHVATDVMEWLEQKFSVIGVATSWTWQDGEPIELYVSRYLPEGRVTAIVRAPNEHDRHRALFAARRIAALEPREP